MPEFVILFHEMPPVSDRASHWDLMLQDGNKLLTWALDNEPTRGLTVEGRELAEHNTSYLTFEGRLSGDRGHVRRVGKGIFEWKIQYDPDGWGIRMIFKDSVWNLQASRIKGHCFEFVFS